MTWEVSVAIILVGIVFFFIKLAEFLTGDEWFHRSVRLLLILLSVWLVVIGANTCIELAVANAAPADLENQFHIFYSVVVYVAWIFTFLFVLYFIYQIFMAFRIDKKQKSEDILGK